MTTATAPTKGDLEKAEATLKRMQDSKADVRAVRLQESKIRTMQTALGVVADTAATAKANARGANNSAGKRAKAEKKAATTTKPKPKPRAKAAPKAAPVVEAPKPKPAPKPTKVRASGKPKPVPKAAKKPAKKAAATATTRAPRGTPKETVECWDGCGAMAAPGRRFVIGHDAKLKSMILKLEKGTIKKKDLPARVQKLIKQGVFRACSRCGMPLMIPGATIGPICAAGGQAVVNAKAAASKEKKDKPKAGVNAKDVSTINVARVAKAKPAPKTRSNATRNKGSKGKS